MFQQLMYLSLMLDLALPLCPCKLGTALLTVSVLLQSFLHKALMPLHKPKCVGLYHQQLAYCVTQVMIIHLQTMFVMATVRRYY